MENERDFSPENDFTQGTVKSVHREGDAVEIFFSDLPGSITLSSQRFENDGLAGLTEGDLVEYKINDSANEFGHKIEVIRRVVGI